MLGGLTSCGQDQPLRIAGQSTWPGYSFMYMAQKQGLLPKDEITLINTSNLGESSAMLAKGKVDGAAITLDEVLRIRDLGIPVSVVAILDISAGGDAVLARPEIKNLSDLRGKSIGVEQSSLGTIMLSKLLEAAALKRDDVRVIAMDYDHIKNMEKNNFDAIITYEPNPTLLEDKGMVRLFDSRRLPNLIVDVLAVRTDLLGQHGTALNTLIAGHFNMRQQWGSNPINTAYQLAPILGTKAEEVKTAFHGISLPDARYNRHYLSSPAEELNKSAKEISGILYREKQLKQIPDVTGLFVVDYLPEEN